VARLPEVFYLADHGKRDGENRHWPPWQLVAKFTADFL